MNVNTGLVMQMITTHKKSFKKKVYYPHQKFVRVQKLRMGKEHNIFDSILRNEFLYKSEAKDNQNTDIWHCRFCCPFQGSITKLISIHSEEKMTACTGILCSSCDTSANIKNGATVGRINNTICRGITINHSFKINKTLLNK